MTGTGPGTDGGKGNGVEACPLPDEGSVDARAAPWLLRQKIAIPDRVAGYFDRAALVDRAMPTRRRLTAVVAPGGFGKTTLLGECCRRAREDGIPVAWVSVDEQDEPAVLDTYVACACRSAAAGAPAEVEDLGISILGQVGGEIGSRTGLALGEIEAREGPFVLVFDELERLGSPDAVALLEFLLQRGPANLHLAFSGRDLPAGVNVTGAVLDGEAEILSAEDLRFTSAEVADFFGGKLSGRRLDAVMSESAGWPFALRLSRNELERGARDDARDSRRLVENWVESRLFAGLGAEDREFLLDIGLFAWMDAALLDEVLEHGDSMRRIESMTVLAGLLEPVGDGATDLWRLHPLIREHCARQRFRETPQRFVSIHRRLAGALGRRGRRWTPCATRSRPGSRRLRATSWRTRAAFACTSAKGLCSFRPPTACSPRTPSPRARALRWCGACRCSCRDGWTRPERDTARWPGPWTASRSMRAAPSSSWRRTIAWFGA